MSTRLISLPTQDGYTLVGNLYEPDHANDRVIIVNGATGVRRQYYTSYAQYLCGHGFHVITYDYRGIGDSKQRSSVSPSPRMQHWGEQDLPAVIDWCKTQFGETKLLGVGHSIGGQLIGLAPNRADLSGQLNVASQYAHWRQWRDQPDRINSWIFFHLILPITTKVMGYFPGAMLGSESLPKGVAMDWARWGRNGNYHPYSKKAPIPEGFAAYTGKLCFYGFTDDNRFAPPSTVERMPDLYQSANTDVLIKHPLDYDMNSVGHFGFFKSTMNKKAWEETASWLLTA